MTYFDQIYEIAADDYFLISTQDAGEAGIPQVELAKLSQPIRATSALPLPSERERSSPPSIRLRKQSGDDAITPYEGIPSQSVASAIRSARHTMMDEHLRDAAKKAREQGYLLKEEYDELEKETGWDEEATSSLTRRR